MRPGRNECGAGDCQLTWQKKRYLQEMVKKKKKQFKEEVYALQTIISIDLLPGLLALHNSQILFKKHCTVVSVYADWEPPSWTESLHLSTELVESTRFSAWFGLLVPVTGGNPQVHTGWARYTFTVPEAG